MKSARKTLVTLLLAMLFSTAFLGSPAGASTAGVDVAQATESASAARAVSGVSKVTVPSRYVYKPNTSYQRTLHDYCSYSPDGWYSADFRGPCARHDLCIMEKSKARSGCDSDLLSNMKRNCEYAYSKSWDPRRQTCKGIAYTYYGAVSAKTKFS